MDVNNVFLHKPSCLFDGYKEICQLVWCHYSVFKKLNGYGLVLFNHRFDAMIGRNIRERVYTEIYNDPGVRFCWVGTLRVSDCRLNDSVVVLFDSGEGTFGPVL